MMEGEGRGGGGGSSTGAVLIAVCILLFVLAIYAYVAYADNEEKKRIAKDKLGKEIAAAAAVKAAADAIATSPIVQLRGFDSGSWHCVTTDLQTTSNPDNVVGKKRCPDHPAFSAGGDPAYLGTGQLWLWRRVVNDNGTVSFYEAVTVVAGVSAVATAAAAVATSRRLQAGPDVGDGMIKIVVADSGPAIEFTLEPATAATGPYPAHRFAFTAGGTGGSARYYLRNGGGTVWGESNLAHIADPAAASRFLFMMAPAESLTPAPKK